MKLLKQIWTAILNALKTDDGNKKPVDTNPVNQPPDVKQPENKNKKTPSWYLTMLSWKGKGENDSSFVKYMSGFWKYVGLNYKTIVGKTFAWCGLGVAAALITNNMDFQKDGAGARNWAKFGQAIEWRFNGIPQGAILHLNHYSDCNSSKGNHVTLANGDCSAADLLKKDATIDGLGANQNNQVKVSTYSVKEICAVRWPKSEDYPLPAKIEKSVNCSSNSKDNESTR